MFKTQSAELKTTVDMHYPEKMYWNLTIGTISWNSRKSPKFLKYNFITEILEWLEIIIQSDALILRWEKKDRKNKKYPNISKQFQKYNLNNNNVHWQKNTLTYMIIEK